MENPEQSLLYLHTLIYETDVKLQIEKFELGNSKIEVQTEDEEPTRSLVPMCFSFVLLKEPKVGTSLKLFTDAFNS